MDTLKAQVHRLAIAPRFLFIGGYCLSLVPKGLWVAELVIFDISGQMLSANLPYDVKPLQLGPPPSGNPHRCEAPIYSLPLDLRLYPDRRGWYVRRHGCTLSRISRCKHSTVPMPLRHPNSPCKAGGTLNMPLIRLLQTLFASWRATAPLRICNL